MNMDNIRKVAEEQYSKFLETGDTEGMICFDFQGVAIINPFVDESGRFDVDPVKHYGEAFTNSDFCK